MIPYPIIHIDPVILKMFIMNGEKLYIYVEKNIPIIIRIVSDILHIKHTKKT